MPETPREVAGLAATTIHRATPSLATSTATETTPKKKSTPKDRSTTVDLMEDLLVDNEIIEIPDDSTQSEGVTPAKDLVALGLRWLWLSSAKAEGFLVLLSERNS
ncbi:hypothetical protein LTR28_010918 [Elasticomyces elasticus]|nr:hypothetical protein LTR28_010918 [Elasticomyces elasticus]